MEQTVQEQNNVMIAAFEGRKFYGKHTIDKYGPGTANAYPEMRYHESWDWLIPAWYKFRDLTFIDRKNEIPHSHYCQSISRAICYEDIGGAYSRLSAAIKWHLAYTQHSPINQEK